MFMLREVENWILLSCDVSMGFLFNLVVLIRNLNVFVELCNYIIIITSPQQITRTMLQSLQFLNLTTMQITCVGISVDLFPCILSEICI